MNECDILGGQTYHDPSYIFSGGQDPQTPMIYASCRVVQFADLQIDVDPSPDNRQTARSVVGGRRRAAIIADWYRHDDVRSPRRGGFGRHKEAVTTTVGRRGQPCRAVYRWQK